MSVQSAIGVSAPGQPTSLTRDALVAVLLSLLTLAPYYSSGTLFDWPYNNDSMLRLVQVRDLIAGQGWYDYSQYRMGPEGGFVMHWSRIVDVPVAAIILLVTGLGGSAATGELVSGIVWPTLLLMASILAIVRSARTIGGDHAVLPAVIIGLTTLYSIGMYSPGSFDHHNLQLTFCLLGLWAILGDGTVRRGFGAGAAMAVTMATGLETLPFVAALCAVVAFAFLIEGQKQAPVTVGFGLGFSVISGIAFVATIGPGQWTSVYCDAFSVAHLSIASLGGIGLAAAAAHRRISSTVTSRTVALGALGTGVILLVLTAYPQCLADPYAGLDPRLQTLWLSGVSEAQPVTKIWAKEPILFAKYYATPIAALAVLAFGLPQTGDRRIAWTLLPILLVSVAVSFWQIRGSNFAVAIAVIPLALWVGHKRLAAEVDGGRNAVLAMMLTWIVSLNLCWMVGAGIVREIAGPAAAAESGKTGSDLETSECYNAAANAVLATIPQSPVAAVSNLGSAILKYSPHRVLAGPYHRNIAGNIANLDILMGGFEDSRKMIRIHGIKYIAHCPGNPETRKLVRATPQSLLAALMRNEPPGWLKPVAASPEPGYTIYRVTDN